MARMIWGTGLYRFSLLMGFGTLRVEQIIGKHIFKKSHSTCNKLIYKVAGCFQVRGRVDLIHAVTKGSSKGPILCLNKGEIGKEDHI
jgi:hypothetical protein